MKIYIFLNKYYNNFFYLLSFLYENFLCFIPQIFFKDQIWISCVHDLKVISYIIINDINFNTLITIINRLFIISNEWDDKWRIIQKLESKILINGSKIHFLPYMKYLGVMINDKLNFGKHVESYYL